MSFGWSAGDIISAAKLLYKIGVALKESEGASTDFRDLVSFLETLARTLEHLNALQAPDLILDSALTANLRAQCDHIRIPLAAFLQDIGAKFGPSLGSDRGSKILKAPRKIQWAMSASKQVKRLQERITLPMTAVGLLMGHQLIYVGIYS